MKKQLISALLVASALSLASAQATSTATTSPVLPPPPSVGDTRIDAQIRALNQEMEAKIRALRQEYQTKLKALVGNRKMMVASSSAQFREDRKELKNDLKQKREGLKDEWKDKRDDLKDLRARGSDNQGVEGTSTARLNGTTTPKAEPKGNAWGFFLKFFGQEKPDTR